MRPLQHSIESEKLAAIIDEKTKYYNKLYRQDPGNQYLTLLNSEITFLRDIIMPIVLMNTTLLYSGLLNLVCTSMREIEGMKNRELFDGVIMYYQIREPRWNDIPVLALASNSKATPDTFFNVTLNGCQACVLPVFPDKVHAEMEEWEREDLKRIEEFSKTIDTSKLQISTQKFVKP